MAGLNDEEIYHRLDLAFARFLSQRATFDATGKRRLETLLARLSQQQHQGHSCIAIDDTDQCLLLESGLVNTQPMDKSQTYPLIIEQNHLYLQRYWAYEDRLAKQIKQLSAPCNTFENLDKLLDQQFGASEKETNWQREAAKTAALRDFCIITGGPGTGKTTTVCKILALLQELAGEPLLIALAAPTGKAAMRLQEAVTDNIAALKCAETIKAHIPATAATLHRLLGAKPPSPYFRHDADNPLMFDVVVVDEASMVDLALMGKLVDAVKPGAKLILLGDKDQLASVESGAVLADLIAALPDSTVELKHSYRFDSGIKNLAEAVNSQSHETAWKILSSTDGIAALLAQEQLIPYVVEQRLSYLALVDAGAAFAEIYAEFHRFQVFCANRYGRNGALEINAIIEQTLFSPELSRGSGGWYPGRPVIVMQNNPSLSLYNGDIGICLPDKEQNDNLMVFFQRPDGTAKKYLPARLPQCEAVFAMTIHKSQGSEFNEVLIVLPEAINPVLSKELLYTAITRAKLKVMLVAQEAIFSAAINKKMTRVTGLADKFNRPKP